MQFLGDNIRKFRTELNLTREELSAKLKKQENISVVPRTILNWESGISKPGADELGALSQFFQKDLILFFTPVLYQNALIDNNTLLRADRSKSPLKRLHSGHPRTVCQPSK